MDEIRHKRVATNGVTLHVAESGVGPAVLLLHGWPECWYSWRHQLHSLARAGYRAIAPDIRGYGSSDCPREIASYSMKTLLADVDGLLDGLGVREVAIVGHDWGASIAWTSAALNPGRYFGVVGISVPYTGRAPMPPTELFKQMFGDHWFYILYFQRPGTAEAEFEADIPRAMRTIFAGPPGYDVTSPVVKSRSSHDGYLTGIEVPATLPKWISEADVKYFSEQFAVSKFYGGLNRYRNMDRDWAEIPELATVDVLDPSLFIIGADDPGRAFCPMDVMKSRVPDLAECVVPGAGHWVQQEKPDEVSNEVVSFLSGCQTR
jgi:pimeloyl-ACP methyl ester carboxylesterase